MEAHMKFGFNWPSGFRGEDVLKCWCTTDSGPCLYYKLTSEPKGSGELKKKKCPPVPHLLQAQQAPALQYAKVVGCPNTGSYPAPSPDQTTHCMHLLDASLKGKTMCMLRITHHSNCQRLNNYQTFGKLQQLVLSIQLNLSRSMTKPTERHVRPAKTQKSQGTRPVWSESSLCTQWVSKDPRFLHADSEDSDQTGQMPRLL